MLLTHNIVVQREEKCKSELLFLEICFKLEEAPKHLQEITPMQLVAFNPIIPGVSRHLLCAPDMFLNIVAS